MKLLVLVFHAVTQWKKMLNFSTFERVFSVYPNYVFGTRYTKNLVFVS